LFHAARADLLRRLGRLDEARSWIEEALNVSTSMGVQVGRALFLAWRGEVLALQGHLEEAEEQAQRALALAREGGYRGYEAYVLRLLAELAMRRMSNSNASTRYREALGDSIAETRNLGNGHVMLDYRPFNKSQSGMRTVLPTIPGAKQDYFDAMIGRYGKERTEEIMIAGGTHLLVFPNLILIGVQIRVVQPLAVNSTEVTLYPTLLKGVAQSVNLARLRGHEGFYGPAGGGAPDDLEMFARVQDGLQAQVDPWLLFARGMNRERVEADGSIVGQITDEVPQRGIWSHWKSVMTGVPAEQSSGLRLARAAVGD
jgi:hypothetical protein